MDYWGNYDYFTLLECNHKTIFDSIHGVIELSNFAIEIIDTKIFQRLRYIKQLGTCNFIYHNAVHTRFEHSIGTYHVAGEFLKYLIKNSKENDLSLQYVEELKTYYSNRELITYACCDDVNTNFKINSYLDNYIIELIKIAALCHDLGHGPFSHIFDDVFINNTNAQNSEYAKHENRSCLLLRNIINSNQLLKQSISPEHIDFMCNLINPSDKHVGYIYQIISNNYNNIDVDKFDYITRDSKVLGINIAFDYLRMLESVKVIDNNICYNKQTIFDIINLFSSRHYLHKQVYNHHGVISAQNIINNILLLLNEKLKISDNIKNNNLNEFIDLTDDYILFIAKTYDKTYILYEQLIDKHKLYTLIDEIVTINESTITINKILEMYELNNYSEKIDKNKLIIIKNKIGYINKSKINPLENIYVYNKHTNLSQKSSSLEEITKLLPTNFQEYITLIYYICDDIKNKEIINNIRSCVSKFIV